MRASTSILRLLAAAALALSPGCGPNRTLPMRMSWDADAAVPPLGCVPDLDGRIEARELEPSIGTPVSFLFGPEGEAREVDLAGVERGGGTRRWDLGADYSTDSVARIEAVDPAVVALYRLDEGAFSLLGLASREMDPPEGRTLLPYATPIVLFQLPLEPGRAWVSTADVSGTLRGLPYAGRDTYESRVPAMGELVLPDLTFTQAMRVATRVTISPSAGAPVVNACTSATSWVSPSTAAVPQTPLPSGMRMQAGLPWKGPSTSSLPTTR